MKRNRQIIKENYQDLDPLCSELITWAMGDGAKSGRINPMGLLYEYYYDDNNDALLQVAEEFSDVSGYDMEEVYEAARKAANYYFNYNPIENEVNEAKNMSKKNTIRLTESELKQVINESVKNIISEAYATSPQKDLRQAYAIRSGDEEYGQHHLMQIENALNVILNVLRKNSKDGAYYNKEVLMPDDEMNYIQLMQKYANKMYKVLGMWKKKSIQKLGVQPKGNMYDLYKSIK